jgi:hypothetical protein
MTKIFSALTSCLLIPLLPVSAGAFDRAAEHSARLAGKPGNRQVSTATFSATPVSAASSFGDLQVSDAGYPGRFTQDHVRVLPISEGRWLAVWNDDRFGSHKIFWQLLDSVGFPITANQMIAGSDIGNDCVDPLVLSDSRGKIYLFYRDQTAGELFAARFNSDLSPDHSATLINDTALGAYAGPFDAAIFPDGRIAIVWENYGPSSQTISLHILDSAMTSQLGPLSAPSNVASTQKWVPSVAIDPATGFVIAWEDYRNGQADIFARQFDGTGSPVGVDFSVVPPPASDLPQYAPQVAFCGADKYVIGWLDRRLGQEVYIQQYNPVTGLVGGNRLVTIADTLLTNWNLDLACAPSGALSASWGSFGFSNNINAVRFAAGLQVIGAPSTRNLSTTGRRWSPATAYATNKRYGMAWTEFQNEDANIHLMLFDTASVRLLGNERRLNDDQVGSPSTRPSIAASSDWYDLIVFESRRRDAGDIFCQAISVFGIIPEHNQAVSQDTGVSLQSEPSISAASGKALVTWIDSRPLAGIAGQRIFGRFGGPSGMFTENEFCISDTSQASVKSMPHSAMAGSGRALIGWLDKRSGNMQVWGRWLSTTGALDGAEFAISQPLSDLQNDRLQVSTDSTGRFYVVWLDRNGASPTVKCRWYNADKSAGGSWTWTPSNGVKIDNMEATNLPGGNVAILWNGLDVTVMRLYLAVITPAGGISRQLFDLADSPLAWPDEPTISVARNGYVSTAWVDSRSGRRLVFYQLYDPALSPINSNAPISSATPEFMTQPVTHTSRGRAWFAWVDPRANGLQVYASNLLYLPTDVDDSDGSLPTDFTLEQNYPNPFNPSTTIEFSLPKSSFVSLEIYNVLGQSVATLANNAQFSAGQHKLVWDGRDNFGDPTASGVYFYRLVAGDFTQQKKMMLLK